MNQGGPRGRALYGGNGGGVDPESLEKDNDANIHALGDRVGLLRQLTHGIKSEVDSHHRVIDNLSQDMGGAGLGLQGAVSRFKKVMEEPQQRRIFSMVVGGVVILFILYLLTRRRPA